MTKDEIKPCPFCGCAPEVYPKRPEIEGDGFGQVRCETDDCPANPVVNSHNVDCLTATSEEYIADAISSWNTRASPALAPVQAEGTGYDTKRLPIGTQVIKASGYPFPGEIRSAFTTKAGNERFVVEATGAEYLGMLHIFNGDQLRVAPPATSKGEAE